MSSLDSRGESLAQRVPFSLGEARDLLAQKRLASAALHRCQFVHKDRRSEPLQVLPAELAMPADVVVAGSAVPVTVTRVDVGDAEETAVRGFLARQSFA